MILLQAEQKGGFTETENYFIHKAFSEQTDSVADPDTMLATTPEFKYYPDTAGRKD